MAALSTRQVERLNEVLDLIKLIEREFDIHFRLAYVGGDRWHIYVIEPDTSETFLAEGTLNAAEKVMQAYVKEHALPRAHELVETMINDVFARRLGYCIHC
jgi:hypothetical protein